MIMKPLTRGAKGVSAINLEGFVLSYAQLPGNLVEDACRRTVADARELASYKENQKTVRARVGRLALIATAAARSGRDVFVSADDFTLIAKHYLKIGTSKVESQINQQI